MPLGHQNRPFQYHAVCVICNDNTSNKQIKQAGRVASTNFVCCVCALCVCVCSCVLVMVNGSMTDKSKEKQVLVAVVLRLRASVGA